MSLREDAYGIINCAIEAVMPQQAVQRVLEGRRFTGRVVMVAIGKAAYAMASAAVRALDDQLTKGIVITKYNHAGAAAIPHTRVCEAGHPIPDDAGVRATAEALDMVTGLEAGDTVLLLISGGGSALFESPLVPLEELAGINSQLLASGADITEINTLRKRLSAVKAGRFAQRCQPAKVLSIVLSDVIGDRLDIIASGPATADSSTTEEALAIVHKYGLVLSHTALEALRTETPKVVDNVEAHITGSVRQLCDAACEAARALGYKTLTLTHTLDCEAREAGSFLGAIGKRYYGVGGKRAILAGGETIVHVTGEGLGGRNQELALSAARQLDGLDHILLFALGSDGTDGPTDAAGGMVNGQTAGQLRQKGLDIHTVLQDNDSYHALEAVDGLIMTGPTGTNVNDLCMLLIDREDNP